MSKNSDKEWRRLGFLQLALMTILWKEELYGKEIHTCLKLRNYEIGAGQLYPALKNLEENGLLEGRVDGTKKGATRKYYQSTEKGRKEAINYLTNFLSLFTGLMGEKHAFVPETALKMVKIKQGMMVADFSRRVSRESLEMIARLSKMVEPTGRIFLTSESEEQSKILKDRIAHFEIEKTASLLELTKEGKMLLPDESMDCVLSIFTIREEKTEWILPEMKRVLKPEGTGLILEMMEEKEETHVKYAFLEMLIDLINIKIPIGIKSEILIEKIAKNQLEIVERKEKKGVIFLTVKKTSRKN